MSIESDTAETLVGILSGVATRAPGLTPQQYFIDLLRTARLQPRWVQQWMGTFTGNAPTDARNLIYWADGLGTNPQDPRFTTLGSILQPVLRDVGLEDASSIAAVIVTNELIRDPSVLERLRSRYLVPQPASRSDALVSIGPEIDWQGPATSEELQAWLARSPEPDFQDVGMLKRAIGCAASVCRIELPDLQRTGTAFLIGERLVLTCYHVLKWSPGEDVADNARNVVLRFGCFTAQTGDESVGQTFQLDADKPVLDSSPTDELDYVLLGVEKRIVRATDIRPVSFETGYPAVGSALNILQHPEGASMQLALSSDGITGVYPNRGVLQYVTHARGGSSGAPCFNADWRVVAIHHAERSRPIGTIREGILFGDVLERIRGYLDTTR